MEEDHDVLRLWRACHSGNTDLVQELIEEDVDYTRRDRNGETVLHMAARSDSADIVDLLLDHLSPDVQNKNDQTPLHLAASKGHIKVVDVLLLAACNLDRQTKYSEMTALHLACQNDRGEVVSALLEGGAVCNVTDTVGKPPNFYTMDPYIHQLFSDHAKHCTHHQDKDLSPLSGTIPTNQSGATSSDQAYDTEDDHQKDTTPTDRSDTVQSPPKKNLWKTAVDKQRKVKINHGLEFSEQHKRRMEMNVFDRLMGNKKK